MLILLCFRFLREAKNAPFIYPAFKVPILIRIDSLTSEESKAKNVCKYLICRMSYEGLTVVRISMIPSSNTHNMFYMVSHKKVSIKNF